MAWRWIDAMTSRASLERKTKRRVAASTTTTWMDVQDRDDVTLLSMHAAHRIRPIEHVFTRHL